MWPLAIFLLTYVFTQSQCTVLEERQELLERELAMMVGSSIKLSDSELKANEIIMNLKNEEIQRGFIQPKYFNLSKHFFEYKEEVKKTKLFQIIQSMPKGAVLHAHDTGLLSPDYVLALTYWDDLWVCFTNDKSNVEFHFSKTTPAAPCATHWKLMKDARNASGDVTKFDADLRKHFSLVIDNPNEVYTDVNAAWKKFQQYFICTGNLFSYKPVYEQYYYDTLLEFRKDQVMYLEIRSTLPSLYDLEGNVFDAVETANTYKRVTEKFMRDYPDFFGAKLIYAPLKLVDKATLKEYIRIALLIQALMPDFLVGFDLVGQEDLGVPLKEFAHELAEVRESLDLYLHAGETNWYGTSSDENLFDAIVLGAKRIGHAFALIKHPLLMEEVKKRQIALEVNVVSNSVLKLVEDPRNHPLANFLSQNMPVVLSSDDPGIWEALPMSHDFYVTFVAVASRHADLKLMKQLALNSLYYSSYPEKHKLVHAFEIRWTKFIDAIVKDKW
uniref:Adenosine deaminase n=1 Tax=Mamestra brassicae TaxID=55057 RepID=A6M8U8_MAMBR|nr:adenosine deaminase-related growth factor-like protein [Mamestra brassicae]